MQIKDKIDVTEKIEIYSFPETYEKKYLEALSNNKKIDELSHWKNINYWKI